MALVPTDVQHPRGVEDRVLGVGTTTSSTVRQIDGFRAVHRPLVTAAHAVPDGVGTSQADIGLQHNIGAVARLVPSSGRRVGKVDAGAHATTRPAAKAMGEDTVGCARVGGMVESPDPEVCVGAGGDVALRERRSRVDAHQERPHGEVTMAERRGHGQDQGAVLTVDDDKVLESVHGGGTKCAVVCCGALRLCVRCLCVR